MAHQIGLAVFPFTEQDLFRELANEHFDESEVAEQRRARYLFSYLAELSAKSIVVEDPYTDAGYLDDFAAYYVRCHTQYSRRCRRLHFFKTELDAGWFDAALHPDGLARLQAAYLGFIVARPLPDAIIGRTVLRTYDSAQGRRNYPVTLNYDVHLCGLSLRVEKGLAFQEQDTILAACATVALWSCFQKTSHLFQTTVPTPSTITRAATQFAHRGRPIPSHGLYVPEICSAIRHVGLEPELFEIGPKLALASMLYGYLHMGLPVILGVDVRGQGGHAITLVGYSMREVPFSVKEKGAEVPMSGRRIDGLYGHDDQEGPYSRLDIRKARAPAGFDLESRGYRDDMTGAHIPLRPTVAIVPVYNKIRITFLDVQKWLTGVHRLFAFWLRGTPLEWDLRLCTGSEYKSDLQGEGWVTDGHRDRGLRQNLPRFLWRATLWADGHVVADFLFDATGLARTLPIISVEWPGERVAERIEQLLASGGFAATADLLLGPRLSRFLADSLAHRH